MRYVIFMDGRGMIMELMSWSFSMLFDWGW